MCISSLDGYLNQVRGHYTQVHYLFNNIISNRTENSFDSNLMNTWQTSFEIPYRRNLSIDESKQIHSSLLAKSLAPLFGSNNNDNNQKYTIILSSSAVLLLMINFCTCIILSRREYSCRKRHYNCLNNHKQVNLVNKSEQNQHQQQHGGSSPASTNSNGTTTVDSTQQLIVNINSNEQERHSSPLSSLLCTTTNSSIASTPPVDVLLPINVAKKSGILKCSSIKRSNALVTSSLPEAIV